MREIKFRAWDEEKKNLYSVRGTDELVFWKDQWTLYNPLRNVVLTSSKTGTLMQSTGLHDRTGVEIWEGDIVTLGGWWDASGSAGYERPEVLVEWVESDCGFHPFANYDSDCGVQHQPELCVVIGNIHNNPELLADNED